MIKIRINIIAILSVICDKCYTTDYVTQLTTDLHFTFNNNWLKDVFEYYSAISI